MRVSVVLPVSVSEDAWHGSSELMTVHNIHNSDSPIYYYNIIIVGNNIWMNLYVHDLARQRR